MAKRKRPRKKHPKIGNCDYHLHLRGKRTKLFRCKYCGKYFCKEHLRAKPPGPAHFKAGKREDEMKIEEWRKAEGHPCPDYLEQWEWKEELERRKYSDALEKAILSPPKKKPIWHPVTRKPTKTHVKPFRWSRRRERIKKAIIALIILGILGYFLYHSGIIESFIENTSNAFEGIGDYYADYFEPLDPYEIESKIHNLINEERKKQRLSPLVWDDKLAKIARGHSRDMVDRDFFSHDNPDGEDPTERGNQVGYTCYKDYGTYYTKGLAENINQVPIGDVESCGSVYTVDQIAKCVVDGWMSSSGHRENILDNSYDKEGIGVAISSDDEVFITQNFC